uniref:JmjC domain-containing protein n=1 Tax=Rhizochromulina marina TaxID=1034831 RepID=A0A7S2SEZ1_9STRA|mmetsp:Transcript_2924/g.8339  ORF Transcript_2924/g.8339 Transcript_2924/m.8339 type:complete len:372 (+) Transcript_2924:137-1252(+)
MARKWRLRGRDVLAALVAAGAALGFLMAAVVAVEAWRRGSPMLLRWGLGELAATMVPSALLPESVVAGNQQCRRVLAAANLSATPVLPTEVPVLDLTRGLPADAGAVDLSRPLLLRGALAGSPAAERWNLDWLAESPRGDIEIDYYSDARTPAIEGGTIPDARGRLAEVVGLVKAGAPVKAGTELLFRQFPSLLAELPLELLHELFGSGHFSPRRMGTLLTAPIFLAQGKPEAKETESSSRTTARTDLHCEPIANVALQITGRKRWTIVDPANSFALQPALSPDGRAYVFADLDPDSHHLVRIPRFEVVLGPGEALYLPTWWWHRVDYLGEASFTASLFHFRPGQMIRNNPIFTAVLVPNLFKELVGWKTQ